HNLIACFELHTFSSLSQNFLSQYADCMNHCDHAAVFYSEHALKLKRLPPLRDEMVREAFNRDTLMVCHDNAKLHSWIEARIDDSNRPTCLLLMSSGSFEGMEMQF